MAYKPLEQKIIPSGLNLLAPGDAMPDGDCLDISGWWPGAVGRLQQSPQGAAFSAVHFGLPWFDSLCQAGSRTYFGGSGNLYQVGRAAEVAIDTGFNTTYPLAMIAYQGYVWIINSTKQRKDDGSTVSDWVPAPPGQPTLTNPATTSASLSIYEIDPASPGTGGTFTQINMWPVVGVAGVEIGALVTVSGLAGAHAPMNGTWLVAAVFAGSPQGLIEMVANPPISSSTTFVTGSGAYTFVNPCMPLGTHSYWVTWVYGDLGESNPSSVAGVVTATTVTVNSPGTKVHVAQPASPPASAIGWNVYRQSPGMASAYLVNQTMIPIATTTYDDFGDVTHSQDNSTLVDIYGVLMQGDHGPAPPARIMANQVYNGRIVVANSSTYPNRVWYTPALQPGFFRGSDNPQAGDWVDIGTDRGDEILAMIVRPNLITVYRRKSIWRIRGDFGDATSTIEIVVPDLGIVGPQAVVSTSLGDYFRSTEAVHKFNGDWAQKISAKIDPVLRGLPSASYVPLFSGENQTYRANCTLGFKAGRLWVSLTTGAGVKNNEIFQYHVETDRWFAQPTGYGAFLDIGTAFLSAGFSQVTSLESTYTNDPLNYCSAYIDCGYPDHEKTWADLAISHNTGGQTFTIRAFQNKGGQANDVFFLDATFTSSVLTKTVVPLVYPAAYAVTALRGQPIRSLNLAIDFNGAGQAGSPGVVIDTPLIVHYYLEARRAKVFDTDEQDHGLPGITKTVDMVEFDIDSTSGAGVLQIYSDIPGGSMAARLGGGVAIAQTSGRATVRIVLGTPVDGKLLRYVATTTTDFCIYGFRARVTPIGVYTDGSISETWDTRPIPIGS